MSTYWYFECLDHEPPIRSEDEFTQHTADSLFEHGIALALKRPLQPDDYHIHSCEYFDGNARRFLIQHPSCSLGLVNEYGDRRALGGDPT